MFAKVFIRRIAIPLFSILIIPIAIVITSCENDIEKVKLLSNHKIPPVETATGIRILYSDSMHVKSKLTADYGIRYEREQKMEARKNVVVVNEKGETLNTEHLIWDERTEKLRSNEFVKITTKGEIIMGTGFEANQDFSKYKIFNIKGTIPLNQNEHAPNS